jgi:hypothetical protein
VRNRQRDPELDRAVLLVAPRHAGGLQEHDQAGDEEGEGGDRHRDADHDRRRFVRRDVRLVGEHQHQQDQQRRRGHHDEPAAVVLHPLALQKGLEA